MGLGVYRARRDGPSALATVLIPDPFERGRFRWAAGAAVVVVVAAVAAIAAVRSGDTSTADDRSPALARHVNRAGGYAFRYPRGWKVARAGSVSKVWSRGRHTLVTVGRAPAGGLLTASARLVRSIRASYRDDEILASEIQPISGERASLVSGIGTNRRGVRIRFLAITVPSARRNFAIVVYTAARSDPKRVLPAVESIVDSFGVLRPR